MAHGTYSEQRRIAHPQRTRIPVGRSLGAHNTHRPHLDPPGLGTRHLGLGVLRHFPSGVRVVRSAHGCCRPSVWVVVPSCGRCLGRGLVERAVARRGAQRHRWHCGVCAANHDFVRPDERLGSDRLHGPGGLFGRSVFGTIGLERTIGCAADWGHGVRRAGGHGGPDHPRQTRATHHHLGHALDDLCSAAAGVRIFDWICRPQYHGMGIQGARAVLVRPLCRQLHFGSGLGLGIEPGVAQQE